MINFCRRHIQDLAAVARPAIALRLWGMCLILNIIIGSLINVMSNKFIMTSDFTVSNKFNSSDYKEPL